jgi:hypothetical protein
VGEKFTKDASSLSPEAAKGGKNIWTLKALKESFCRMQNHRPTYE